MARRKRPSADVAAWIEILLSPEPQDDDFARAKALFDFSSYLRWPSDAELRDLASVIMTARYVTATLMPGPDLETPIPSDRLPSLFRYAHPTNLVSIILDQKTWEVFYEDLIEDDRQRTAANIVRFLISETSKKGDRTEQPSIKKCRFVMENFGAYGKMSISEKTFNDIWRKYKGTCFFHYVNEYHFKRRWHLNPQKPDFKASVDRLLADRSGLETFFRQSLRVMNDLVRILDRRALQGVALPQFPSRIEPAQTVTTRADPQITARLKHYSVKAEW